MEYKRFDGVYWFISFVISLITCLFLELNGATIEAKINCLVFLFITFAFLVYKVYKWFQEES